jgi:hypothetical protein
VLGQKALGGRADLGADVIAGDPVGGDVPPQSPDQVTGDGSKDVGAHLGDVSVFAPHLRYVTAKGVPTLSPASILVHMAASPAHVRSWVSAIEWLPDVAAEVSAGDILAELRGRPATVTGRLGYLLQGLRPDVAGRITGPSTKTWFGPRRTMIRHDTRWQVADTLLPFDPRTLEAVA